MAEGASVLRRRNRVLWAMVGVAVLFASGGWFASGWVKSSQQALEDAAAPDPTVLTAPVEHRKVTNNVILRGTVTASRRIEVVPAGAGGEGQPVVTDIAVEQGAEVEPGQLLAEVSGRPVFALPGKVPVYRDLKPGSSGDDVAQLQRALRKLGHETGDDEKGSFGSGTKEAVRSFYEDLGYDPVPATPSTGEQVGPAERAVREAERTVERAEETYADAVAARDRARENDEPYDEDALEQAERDLSYAREDLRRAEERLATARAHTGPMVPAAEVVFATGFPARVDRVSARVGDEATERLLTLAAGTVRVTSAVPEHQVDLVRAGQRARVFAETYDERFTGKVTRVADEPTRPGEATGDGGDGGSGGETGRSQQGVGGYRFTVKPKDPIDARLIGQDVRVTIAAASSEGKVLVVPVSAVSAQADGRATVTVYDGEQRDRVTVEPGISGDGHVQVSPAEKGALQAGDQVIVGTDGADAGQEAEEAGGADDADGDSGARGADS